MIDNGRKLPIDAPRVVLALGYVTALLVLAGWMATLSL